MPITQGLTKNCNKSCPGGVKRLWLTNAEDVASYTFDTDGSVTAITMVATKVFFPIDFKTNSKQLQQTVNMADDGCGGSVAQVFVGNAQCYDQDARTFIREAVKQSCCGMVSILEMNSGFVGVWGYIEEQHVRIGSGTVIDSGTSLTDPSQITLQLLCDTTVDGLLTEFTPGTAGIPV